MSLFRVTVHDAWEAAAMLTSEEHETVDLLARAANAIHKIIYAGNPHAAVADGDWAEAAAAVHVLQHMVMAQSAAREHPETYRLLGRHVGGSDYSVPGVS